MTIALLLGRAWAIGHRNLDDDEYEHAHATWLVSQGQTPYVDFFEHHTPALYLLLAPIVPRDVATNADAAVGALFAARALMWLLTIASVAVVYALGRHGHDAATGIVAAALAVTASRFLDTMLEFRPDVPAVLCLLLTFAALSRARERHAAWCIGAGVAYGAAVMFTPKVLFAAPGLVVAFAIDRRRLQGVAAFACGCAVPIAAVLWWFAARGQVGAFVTHAVMTNVRLNADAISPLPRLASQLVQQPALFAFGVAGIVEMLRRPSAAPEGVPLAASAAALLFGIFVIGRANDEYYVFVLPLLAVSGAAVARRLRPTALAAGVAALAVVAVANDARRFHPIEPQIADIRWVIGHTDARDGYVGATPGAALFRPSSWFYFFFSGPFATEPEYAAFLVELRARTLQPRLAIMAAEWTRAPAALGDYVRAHYRPVDGHPAVWMRID